MVCKHLNVFSKSASRGCSSLRRVNYERMQKMNMKLTKHVAGVKKSQQYLMTGPGR